MATAHVPCAGALPLSVIAGLVLRCRRWQKRRRALLDMAALLATLQCLLVLAIWGLLPFRLWH